MLVTTSSKAHRDQDRLLSFFCFFIFLFALSSALEGSTTLTSLISAFSQRRPNNYANLNGL